MDEEKAVNKEEDEERQEEEEEEVLGDDFGVDGVRDDRIGCLEDRGDNDVSDVSDAGIARDKGQVIRGANLVDGAENEDVGKSTEMLSEYEVIEGDGSVGFEKGKEGRVSMDYCEALRLMEEDIFGCGRPRQKNEESAFKELTVSNQSLTGISCVLDEDKEVLNATCMDHVEEALESDNGTTEEKKQRNSLDNLEMLEELLRKETTNDNETFNRSKKMTLNMDVGEREIQNLRTQNEALQIQLDFFKSKTEKMEDERDDHVEQVSMYKQAKEATLQRSKELETQLSKTKQDYEQQLRQIRETLNIQTTRKKELLDELDVVKEELKQTGKLKTRLSDLQKLEENFNNLQDLLKAKEEKLKSLVHENSQLKIRTNKLESVESDLEHNNELLTELQLSHSSLKNKLNSLSTENEHQAQEIEDLKQAREALQLEISSLEAARDNAEVTEPSGAVLNEVADEMKCKLEEFKVENASLMEKVESMKDVTLEKKLFELAQLQKVNDKLEQKLSNLTTEKKEVEETLVQLQKDSATEKEKLEGLLKQGKFCVCLSLGSGVIISAVL